MNFQDEFEYTTNNSTYFVKVEGRVVEDEEFIFNEISHIEVYDSLGDQIDEDHADFSEVYEEALNREYEVEEYNSYFAEDSYIDSFLQEDF